MSHQYEIRSRQARVRIGSIFFTDPVMGVFDNIGGILGDWIIHRLQHSTRILLQ